MIEGITNTVVMVFFGVFIGALLGLITEIGELYSPKARPRPQIKKRAGEGFRAYWRRQRAEADERAEQTRKEMATAPRSYEILLGTFGVFVLIIVVLINVTPLRMNWPAFSGGAVVAWLTTAVIYAMTKKASQKGKGEPESTRQQKKAGETDRKR